MTPPLALTTTLAQLRAKYARTQARVAEAAGRAGAARAVDSVDASSVASTRDDTGECARLVASLESAGFATVANHGVPPELVRGLLAWTRELGAVVASHPDFAASGSPMVRNKSAGAGRNVRGWWRYHETDLFAFGPPDSESVTGANYFPSFDGDAGRAAAFKADVAAYHGHMERVEAVLLGMVERGLALPAGALRRRMGAHRGLLSLNSNRAYGFGNETTRAAATAADTELQTPHTDWGVMTLLFAEPGLEILTLDSGLWQPVGVDASTLVLNVGDTLERWTAGRLQSTIHAVRKDKRATRVSVAFFGGQAMDETRGPGAVPFII